VMTVPLKVELQTSDAWGTPPTVSYRVMYEMLSKVRFPLMGEARAKKYASAAPGATLYAVDDPATTDVRDPSVDTNDPL